MDASKCLKLHHLRREVLASRNRGRVVIEFHDGSDTTELHDARMMADALISIVNLPKLGPHWYPVDRERAATIAMLVLHWDLETLGMRVPEQEATELTAKIFSQFAEPVVYLTNVRPHADISKSPHKWASGSELAELDAGIAIVSNDLVGLIWVEDRP